MTNFAKTAIFVAAALLPLTVHSAPPTIGGCQVFPANSHWNTPIDTLPVHSSSATILGQYGTAKLHPDWGQIPDYGIPYVTVPGSQPTVQIDYDPNGYGDESDPGPFPIPPTAPIEGNGAPGDRHVIVVETTNCILYELFLATSMGGGQSWTAYSGAKFDLKSNALRPDLWTSADAAGLPIFPGLVRWEEVQAGEINHAIRVTLPNSRNTYIWPARHYGPTGNTNPIYPQYGMRIRLKADFNISGFSPESQVILRALKKYGFIYADQGSAWFFTGVSNPNWPDAVFNNTDMKSIVGSTNFEIVDTSSWVANYDSGHVRSSSLRSDLNGDGRTDVLWRDATGGLVYEWQMQGMAISGQGYLPSVPTNWSIAATGDFNADGRADVLWRENATNVYAWMMNGLGIVSQGYLPAVPQPWMVVGVGDANGDGRGDVFWRNPSTGQNYLWLMNGLAMTGQDFLPSVPETNWEVVGVADFSGDGKADVLWRNRFTGQNYLWILNGLVVASQGYLQSVADTNWEVAGTPDADGDGKADVLWRNKVTGANYLWLMSGLAMSGQGFLPAVSDLNWKVAGHGDYDSDGRGDVLWRNAATGMNYLWTLNGMNVATQGYLPSVSGANWQPVK